MTKIDLELILATLDALAERMEGTWSNLERMSYEKSVRILEKAILNANSS